MSKFKDFSRTSPASPTAFKDLKLMKNTDLSVQIPLQKCYTEIMGDSSTGNKIENRIKLVCLYLVQHMLHQIKAQQFYTDLGLLSTVLIPTENSRIQGLFKAFE